MLGSVWVACTWEQALYMGKAWSEGCADVMLVGMGSGQVDREKLVCESVGAPCTLQGVFRVSVGHVCGTRLDRRKRVSRQ